MDMGYKNVLFNTVIGVASHILGFMGTKTRARFLGLAQEKLLPIYPVKTRHGILKFYCPGRTPLSRSDSYHIKETENYALINSFDRGSTFWDIGANVGVYSMYAAAKGDRVFAFEPAAMNYSILTKNIELNGFINCLAYPIAISDKAAFNILNMTTTIVGKGGNTIGNNEYTFFKSGCVSFTVDELIHNKFVPMPTYMKIDVDGVEDKVLQGAQNTLSKIKGLSVELLPNRFDKDMLIAFIESKGLVLDKGQSHFQNWIFYNG